MSRGRLSIERALQEHLKKGARYLLAVSGGIDSMVLLTACCKLSRQMRLYIEVAHVDHGLRRESASDALFVKHYAQELGLTVHLKKAKPPLSGNLESWGRGVRYDFFQSLCRRRKLDFVLTAHTANDVAETFLMRLFSNKEPRPILRQDTQRHCLRPLLSIPRAEIEAYARAEGVPVRVDNSNSDEQYLRNRVRHTVLPLLAKQFDKRIVEVLALRAQRVAEDLDGLDTLTGEILEKLNSLQPWSKVWRHAFARRLARLPEAMRWRLAELTLLPKLGFRIGATHSRRVVSLIEGKCEAVELPRGITLRSTKGAIEMLGLRSKSRRLSAKSGR